MPPEEASLFSAYQKGRLSRGHVERLATELAMRHAKLACDPYSSLCQLSPRLKADKFYDHCLEIAQRVADSLTTCELRQLSGKLAGSGTEPCGRNNASFDYECSPGVGYSGSAGRILKNVFLHEGQMVLGEVSPGKETTGESGKDALSDVACVLFELELLGLGVLANYFMGAWLEYSGDFDALGIVRTLVAREALLYVERRLTSDAPASFPLGEDSGSDTERALRIGGEYLAQRPKPKMIITCGFSGAGKTTLATAVAGYLGAIVVRIDAERSRLWLIRRKSGQRGSFELRPGELVDRIEELTGQVISAGWTVIVDSCFLQGRNRERFRTRAAQLDVPFCILSCSPPLAVVRERLDRRRAFGSFFYGQEVSPDKMKGILQEQLDRLDPLDPDECAVTVSVDTSKEVDHQLLANRILRFCQEQEDRAVG